MVMMILRVVKTSNSIGDSAERSTLYPYCWRQKKHFSYGLPRPVCYVDTNFGCLFLQFLENNVIILGMFAKPAEKS